MKNTNNFLQQDQKLQNFLQSKLYGQNLSVEEYAEQILQEIRLGLSKQGSTLPMLPAFVSLDQQVPSQTPVVVIDAGGSNLRVARISFDKAGEERVAYFHARQMPGIGKPCSEEEFLQVLSEELLACIEGVDYIGFCFSYPIEIQANGDGKILAFGKEVDIQGMQGKYLIESLATYMKKHNYPFPKYAMVVNDTVAALLGGVALAQQNQNDLGIGFILGTGMNMAYVEKTEQVHRLSEAQKQQYKSQTMVMNMELGCYSPKFRGKVDQRVDELSSLPGDHQFEKMLSGRYLGNVFSSLIESLLLETSYFSSQGRQSLQQALEKQRFTTIEMSFYRENSQGENRLAKLPLSEDDRSLLLYCIDLVIDRTAKLLVASFLAALKQTGKGRDPLHPLSIVMDGSTYYKTYGLQERVQFYVQSHLQTQGYYVRFYQIDQGNLLGAGIAALTKKK